MAAYRWKLTPNNFEMGAGYLANVSMADITTCDLAMSDTSSTEDMMYMRASGTGRVTACDSKQQINQRLYLSREKINKKSIHGYETNIL
jgi:hypothetical protein